MIARNVKPIIMKNTPNVAIRNPAVPSISRFNTRAIKIMPKIVSNTRMNTDFII